MNRLSAERRCAVLQALVEGVSIRGTERITGVSKPTILKLLRDMGTVAADQLDKRLRNLPCLRIECDEMWGFIYAKQKNLPLDRRGTTGYGDIWTWVAMDPESKLVVSWLLERRTEEAAEVFMRDLASRLGGRVQLTTDAWQGYVRAVYAAFARDGVDYMQLLKTFRAEQETKTEKYAWTGNPDPKWASTSHVERQNLTMRMEMRRLTRKTNAFSKKMENLRHHLAIHFLHYNFARPHMSLSGATPAQAIGISQRCWTIRDMVGLLEDFERISLPRPDTTSWGSPAGPLA